MTANAAPPTLPERLLNHVVDAMAKENADALYAELPLSPASFGAGFRKVTYRAFANAINGMAWWLHRTLGPGKNFETLLYLGPNDLRHNLLLLGAVKSGYKMLFTSPRYSTLAQINLIKLVDCKTVLAPAARPPVTDAILDAYEMRVYQIPELEELFDQNHPYYPFEKTFEQARGEPLVVLHTSGTTGLPKPIIWTHDWAASFARERRLAPPLGFESLDNLLLGNRVLSMTAPFHAGHLCASVLFAIFCRTTVIYPPSAVPSSAELAVECLKHTKADAVALVPPYVEEIGRSPEILDFLSRNVETLFWAGGDVSLAAGNAISSKMKLFTTCGSTEMGMWPTLRRSGKLPSEYWKFMNIHHAANIEFRHQSDNLHEAVVKRNPEFEDEQPIFKIFPTLQEFSSGDLFSPHPLDPQLWQYCGRTDDMQVFSSGELYHPVTVEQRINRHPDVEEALLVGTQQPRAALLLEMKADTLLETPGQQADAIARLWPVIQDANQLCPVYAKITKEHILFVHPHKPMARAAKGTVQRKATTQLYKEELDRLFTSAAAASVPAPLTAHSLITYLIVGGLGGIGRSIARWFVGRGARNLILLSRSGAQSKAALAFLKELKEHGTRVEAPPCDITDATALRNVLERCAADMPSIKGCGQGSMVLRDALFENMSSSDWNAATACKTVGSWNLHMLLPKSLDFFIMLASASGVGEKAVSLDLGAMTDDGLLAENVDLPNRVLAYGALSPISREQFFAIFDYYCNPALPVLSLCQSQSIIGLGSGTGPDLDGLALSRQPLFHHLRQGEEAQASAAPSGEQGLDFRKLFSE